MLCSIFLNYYYVIIVVLLLCDAAQFKVTNRPLRAEYQFIILYFLFVLYVCTRPYVTQINEYNSICDCPCLHVYLHVSFCACMCM